MNSNVLSVLDVGSVFPETVGAPEPIESGIRHDSNTRISSANSASEASSV